LGGSRRNYSFLDSDINFLCDEGLASLTELRSFILKIAGWRLITNSSFKVLGMKVIKNNP